MADTNISQSVAPSTIAWTDLQINITPRAYTQYQGTAAQLIAEGLIPPGFKWPAGANRVTIEVGQFSLWIGRKRPEGHKGPMSSWTSGDYWFARRTLASEAGSGFHAADIYEKSMELAKVIYRGTNEHAHIGNAWWRAKCDDKYMAHMNKILGEPKRRGRPRNSGI